MPVQLNEKSALDAIPMTPLIDVVFLLLIFFLVAATISDEERQMDVQLPSASEAQPLTAQPREVVININRQGQFVVSRENVTLQRLEQILQTAAASNPGRASVLIRADRQCQWEAVVAAMNACNRVKIRNYKVTTLKASA